MTRGEWICLQKVRASTDGSPVIVDVGYNRGAYTDAVFAMWPDAQVIAFEPNPELNPLKCHMEKNFLFLRDALSSSCKHEKLFVDPQKTNIASLHQEHLAEWGAIAQTQIELETKTLDVTMDEHRVDQIDLLKVDTEGHDLSVLQGAKSVIESGRVRFIQFEFLAVNSYLHITFRDFFEMLSGHMTFSG